MHDYPVRYDRFVSFVSDESITVSRRYNLEGKVILENVTIKCGHPHELRHEVLAPKSKATAALQRFPSTQSKAGNLQRLRLSSLYSFSLFWSYSMRSLATSNRSPTES